MKKNCFIDKVDFHDRMQKEAKKVWRDHFVFKSGPMNSVKNVCKNTVNLFFVRTFKKTHWFYTRPPQAMNFNSFEQGSGKTNSPSCYVCALE